MLDVAGNGDERHPVLFGQWPEELLELRGIVAVAAPELDRGLAAIGHRVASR
jgi:hypothetical protein